MKPEDFNFAQGKYPSGPTTRGEARLMIVNRRNGEILHSSIKNLELFIGGTEIWANNSYNNNIKDFSYHCVYSEFPGSHATPSAGIHLTVEQVVELQIKTLTLHIGNPREQKDILEGYKTNIGWYESYAIPVRIKNKVTAIGTTVVKAIETYARTGSRYGSSCLFIQPDFEFKLVDKLLTNFHYAKETLLALTCAFGGIELIREAYEVAVRENYGFSDYGDRLLII